MSESYFDVSLTKAQRIVIEDLFPQMADRLKLDVKGPSKIAFTVSELQAILWCAGEEFPVMTSDRKRSSLRCIITAFQQAIRSAHGIDAIPVSRRLYQFRISLRELEPPIWRRIQVPQCSLDKLHEHIQTAMGWTNSHLHRFEIQGIIHGDPELLCDSPDSFVGVDSRTTSVSDVVPQSGIRFRFSYKYDFGDRWEHEVLFEGCLGKDEGVRYPLCLEGERACPPEDVGGISGYQEFLKAIADPLHDEHVQWKDWAGGDFDPECFDPGCVTRTMQRGLPLPADSARQPINVE